MATKKSDKHNCIRSGEIAVLMERTEKLDKIIDGTDSKPGIRDTVTELNVTVKGLTESTERLSTMISGFHKFQSETIGGIQAAERIKVNMRWAIGTLVAAFGIIASITVTLIRHSETKPKAPTEQKVESPAPVKEITR
jgi:hypothetical protein